MFADIGDEGDELVSFHQIDADAFKRSFLAHGAMVETIVFEFSEDVFDFDFSGEFFREFALVEGVVPGRFQFFAGAFALEAEFTERAGTAAVAGAAAILNQDGGHWGFCFLLVD